MPIFLLLLEWYTVPLALADILARPLEDAAVLKKCTKCITGSRELTSNEYVEWLREKEKEERSIGGEGKEKRRKK